MARLMALAACASDADASATPDVTLGDVVVHSVEEAFLSYTIDSASLCHEPPAWPFPEGLDTVTTERMRLLSPLVLRYGGTSQDWEEFSDPSAPRLPLLPKARAAAGMHACNLTESKWAALVGFAETIGARLVYGLNALLRRGADPTGAWDPSNADALFALAARRGDARGVLRFVSLGNEPSNKVIGWANVSVDGHARDWATLRRSLRTHFGADAPLTLGPDYAASPFYAPSEEAEHADAHGEELGAYLPYQSYFSTWMASAPDVDIVTIHSYPIRTKRSPDDPAGTKKATWADFYDHGPLNNSQHAGAYARNATTKLLGANVSVWVTEGSPNWHVPFPLRMNLTFELVFVDMLGSFARTGVELFARQDLNSVIGPGYVRPGFWVSLLWKQLMGADVVDASVSSAASTAGVRAYSHRTPAALREGGWNVSVLLINISPGPVTVSLAPPRSAVCTAQEEYHVTAGSTTTILVNGVEPSFANASSAQPPRLAPSRRPACAPVAVAARSFSFAVLALRRPHNV